MPKISIIVPIYNVEKYLQKCIDSIMTQDFTDFECLLIDDCSQDSCAQICEKVCKIDNRFKYIKRQENGGLGAARNTGLDNVTGEYVTFIDSDDTIAENFCSTLLPYAEKYSWVRSGIRTVDITGNETDRYKIINGLYKKTDRPLKILSSRDTDLSSVCCCLFKRSLIDNLRFDKCKYGEDYIFSLTLFNIIGQVYFLDQYLYNYYLRSDSLSGKKTVNKYNLLTFLNSFTAMLRGIKSPTLRAHYIKNFEQRNRVKEFCHDGIDFVFPYVDGSEPEWWKQYCKAKGSNDWSNDQEVDGVSRYRANGYLKYLFRGINTYLPWINKIHMIVSSEEQVPAWLDRSKVHIVLHKDIIPAALLPTFNSSTIEMFYHNIVGLSDKFIYGNDDVFILNSCIVDDFFDGDKPRLQMRTIDNVNGQEIWRKTNINSYRLATNNMGKQLESYRAPEHGLAPYTKAVITEFNTKYTKELYDSCTQFRAEKNLNMYMYACYLDMKRQLSASKVTFRFIGNSYPLDKIVNDFSTKQVICLNDTDASNQTERQARISALFAQKFKKKCVYELDGTDLSKEKPVENQIVDTKAIKKPTERKQALADGKVGYYLAF